MLQASGDPVSWFSCRSNVRKGCEGLPSSSGSCRRSSNPGRRWRRGRKAQGRRGLVDAFGQARPCAYNVSTMGFSCRTSSWPWPRRGRGSGSVRRREQEHASFAWSKPPSSMMSLFPARAETAKPFPRACRTPRGRERCRIVWAPPSATGIRDHLVEDEYRPSAWASPWAAQGTRGGGSTSRLEDDAGDPSRVRAEQLLHVRDTVQRKPTVSPSCRPECPPTWACCR